MADSENDTCALAVGRKLVATIHDIAFGGEGVARVDGLVLFVPFVLIGEEVEVEITDTKKKFARARLLRVLKASPERVIPQCRYFGGCGGCQYQHIDYAAQLRLKHKQITDLLQRIGGFAGSAIEPVVPCPQQYGYRNRIMVRSQWDKLKKGTSVSSATTAGSCWTSKNVKSQSRGSTNNLDGCAAIRPPRADSKWCCALGWKAGTCRAIRSFKIIFFSCRNWSRRCASACVTAACGIWWTLIAAWASSPLSWAISWNRLQESKWIRSPSKPRDATP